MLGRGYLRTIYTKTSCIQNAEDQKIFKLWSFELSSFLNACFPVMWLVEAPVVRLKAVISLK
jgi:hypothetical protein